MQDMVLFANFEDLIARNKAGKALISLPENAKVLKPEILSESTSLLVSLTSAGRMLIFRYGIYWHYQKGKATKSSVFQQRMQKRGQNYW